MPDDREDWDIICLKELIMKWFDIAKVKGYGNESARTAWNRILIHVDNIKKDVESSVRREYVHRPAELTKEELIKIFQDVGKEHYWVRLDREFELLAQAILKKQRRSA